MSKVKLKEVTIINPLTAVYYDGKGKAHRQGEKVKLTEAEINHKNNRGNFRVNVKPEKKEK